MPDFICETCESCEAGSPKLMTVFQVTPAYPPMISGVGDYAARLTDVARRKGLPVETIVTGSDILEQFSEPGIIALQEPTGPALARMLSDHEAAHVLLHFSGYGFARRGLCQWLVEGLAAWKRGGGRRRIVTVFHEIYATGPIWRMSFWTAAPQRRIARELAQLTDIAFVSSQGGYDRLRPLCLDLPLRILPVFSNVGEPAHLIPLKARDPIAVVFGGIDQRRQFYSAAARAEGILAAGFDGVGVTEVIDIGPGHFAPKKIAGRKVRALGISRDREVSATLSRARVGLVDYPKHVLTKSGIAAAYFAHALIVVNTSNIGCAPASLRDGHEFLSLERLASGKFDPDEVAQAGRAWYQPHGITSTAETLLHSMSLVREN